jgi:leucine dehydrogenase
MTLLALPDFTHERVTTVVGHRSGLTMAVALHSSALGPGLGGCRMWRYNSWGDGLADVLRLSAAMTLKNALADIGYGGGKAVIALGPNDHLDADRRSAALHDMGDLIEQFDGGYITAEDVGTTEYDMLVVRERTQHVVGLPPEEGGEGEPADGTALGVFVAIERALAELDGSASLAGRRIVISGLGQVGGRLARRLAAAGASLAVTDIVASRRALADEIGADWIEVDAALTTPADVFVPAGLGGILTDETIDTLPARAVVGPANNPLADRSGAERLARRGILYAPDFLVSAGGVIHLSMAARGVDPAEIERRLRGIGDTLDTVFAAARASAVTPLDAAETLALARVRGGTVTA